MPFRRISCHISIDQNSTMRRSKVSKTLFSISFLIHFHGILLLSSHRIVSYRILICSITTQHNYVRLALTIGRNLDLRPFSVDVSIRNFRCLNRKLGRIDQGRIRVVHGSDGHAGRVGSGHDFPNFWRVGSGQHFGFFCFY